MNVDLSRLFAGEDKNYSREDLDMYKDIAKLILYGDLDKDSILYQMGEIFRKFETKEVSDAVLIREIYTQIKHLLNLATEYGFDKNLWHNYLTYFLITNENSFSITSEKVGANDGSVNHFAHNDRLFQQYLQLQSDCEKRTDVQ